MTSQSRGIGAPQYQPSQSLPIPNRYNQPQHQQFGPSQAYSPRHVSSSPHQQYYPQQQPGLPGAPHDMYKAALGMAGTPPAQPMTMPPQAYYASNGQRPRPPPPMQPMQNQPRPYYYPTMQPRFSNTMGPSQTPPSAAFYPPVQQQSQYQYQLQPGAQIQNQPSPMFSPAYPTQFGQPPPQQQQPMMTMQPTLQQSSGERRKKLIRIVNPDTNEDITTDIMSQKKSDLLSTPSSGRSSATPPTTDVAAVFAAKVAAAAGTTKSVSPMAIPSMGDAHAMALNQSQQQYMSQMQDQQVVGSPNMNVLQMGSPNPAGYMNAPLASSPRPSVMQQTYMQQMPTAPAGYASQPSPGHVTNLTQMHRAQMGIAPPMQNLMPAATGYQLTPQTQARQFGMSTPMHTQAARPTNIPEHAQPLRTQTYNVAPGLPTNLGRIVRFPTPPPVSGPVPQGPQPAVEPLEVLQPPEQNVRKAGHDEEIAALSVEKKISETTGPSGAVMTTGTTTTTVVSPAQINKVEAALISNGASMPTASSPILPKTDAEKQDQTVDAALTKQVPSLPEESRHAPEKEDTAIRLEDCSGVSGEGIASRTGSGEPVAEKENAADIVVKAAANAGESVRPDSKSLAADDVKMESETLAFSDATSLETELPILSELKENTSSVPSVKAAVEQPEQKPSAQPDRVQKPAKSSACDEEQKTKSQKLQLKSVATPDSPQSGSVSSPDSSVQQSGSQPAVSQSQHMTNKPVVNGVTLDVSATSGGKVMQKAEDSQAPTASTSKHRETNSAADIKPKVEEAPGTRLASGEKTDAVARSAAASSGSAKPFADQTNGVASDNKPKPAFSEITYSTDQWSPKNPAGKRHYDSSFLLQFQYRPSSLEKPKGLPNIDIVLEQPHKLNAPPMGGSDFIPSYMRAGPRRGPGRQNSRDQHRHSGRSSMSGLIIIKKVVSIDRDVELKTTANAWKPIKRDANLKLSQDESETLEIVREVRAILNKLTPSTFKELMNQVFKLNINTEKKLKGTIDLIFEKAIDEPNFSEAYANMCRQMTKIQVTPEPVPGADPPPAGQTMEFRKLLLTRCQREFEKNKSDQEHLQELKKKMEENTDGELAPQLKEEYGVAEFKERRRTLGNIRFIGELFKLNMLTESIMHKCIMSLFKARDDDHLESLCRLLTTIGKDLDHQKGKHIMEQYFTQIMKIIQEKRNSSRVRFMLQDVCDLRLNKWVPRAIQTQGPKTITQIRQDAKNEEQMLQMKLASTAPAPVNQGGRQQGRTGSRGHGEDGWTRVVQATKPTRYDPNKMKLKPNQFDSANVTLGPSREFGRWKSGSAGAGITRTGSSGYSPSGSMDRTPETGRSNTPTSMMNRFSALSQGRQGPDHDYQRRHGGRQSSREGSRSGSRGSMGPPASPGSGGRTPRRDERSQLLETARQLTSRSAERGTRPQSFRESSPSVTPLSQTPKQPPAAHQYRTDLDEEKMQQKSKNILEEFLSIVDFKEATECIQELNAPPSLMHVFVYVAHEFTLEKKREQRINIGRLMAHLLKLGRLSIEQYVKGLAELLEMAADYEIDVPKVWEYLAEQLAPVFEDETQSDAVPLTCLAELAAPLQEESKSLVFVAEVVKAIIRLVSLESFVARWQKSGLLWSKITGKDDKTVENLLVIHNLQALSDSEGAPRQTQCVSEPKTLADEQYIMERHITQLLEDKATNDDIFAWVGKNIKEEDTTKPSFLRALTMSICRSSIDSECRAVDEEKISDRSAVLKKYIGTNSDRELQALYALQQLMVVLEQPANILRMLFGVLENEDVVSEQTFFKWEKSDDPNEQEGRGVAVASVNPFFTWLRTAEPESD